MKKSATRKPSGRTVVAEGKYIRLVSDGGWEYAERTKASGIVTIVAVTRARTILLTEQFRPPVGRRVIELPAGLAGDVEGVEAEELAAAAARELEEETGYRAAKFELLTVGPPSAGLSTEVVSFFLARGLKKVGDGGGHGGEDIEVHAVALDRVLPWLRRKEKAGRLVDPKVYAGLFFAGLRNPR